MVAETETALPPSGELWARRGRSQERVVVGGLGRLV